MSNIKFAKVKETAIIPSKEDENAGYDVYACWEGLTKKDKLIPPHNTKLFPTGIACALPVDYYFQVEERGSTGSKGIKRSAGVVDSGYRGEIFVALSNVNDVPVIFGNKEDVVADAVAELEEFYNTVSSENITEEERQTLIEQLKADNTIDSNSTQKEIDAAIDALLKVLLSDFEDAKAQLIEEIDSAIIYPETKAIAQLVLHKVENLAIEEISYDELKEIPSKRGMGNLGSSNK